MENPKLLLIIPPMTQLNTPYPSTAYLTGFLKSRGIPSAQRDFSLELALRIFSSSGLQSVFEVLAQKKNRTERELFFLEAQTDYLRTIDPVVRFLQGKDPTLAFRLASRTLVPEGPRFGALEQGGLTLEQSFGKLGVQDQGKHIASLFLDDIADLIAESIDSRFALSRYGEKLAASQLSMDPLLESLRSAPTLLDRWIEEMTIEAVRSHDVATVGLSVPFPGNVYGAFRIAATIKRHFPQIKILLGGGYVNTELRWLSDARVHDYFDAITLDDGERPLWELLNGEKKLRTFSNGQWHSDADVHDIPFKDSGAPSYEGLRLGDYLSMLEMLNPMHRLWSDLRWNKLTLAHGCYWKKCSFCDTSLDYIGRYDPASADLLLDRMQNVREQTGQSGFHFVDEAAPPATLKHLSENILKRGQTFTWWGNIRFEKSFTPVLTRLMSDAGCVAVTGGLEVASDRLLKLMNKGVTIEQVARVTRAFSDAGIMVHAYLMYGFPTETMQETIDSLEVVRQLFEAGCIQSGFWHRFSATVHSPVGLNPADYGVEVFSPLGDRPSQVFAVNDLKFIDPTGCDHDALGVGLKKAIYNFMHGVGIEEDVRFWFAEAALKGIKIPRSSIAKNRIARALFAATSPVA